jgi:hypothetical protein
VPGPISLAAHASRLVLSLRCASALPLPSFPTLHPKPTSPVLVLFPQIIERPKHIAHFLNRFSTPPSPAKHRLVGIPPSPRLHEVSLGYCPLTCIVHRTSIPHSLPAVVIADAIKPCPQRLRRWPRSPQGRVPIALLTRPGQAGISRTGASKRRPGCASPPHTGSGEPGDEVSTAHSPQHQENCVIAAALFSMAASLQQLYFYPWIFIFLFWAAPGAHRLTPPGHR